MTNADRIRSMSDKELAEFVFIAPCQLCPAYSNKCDFVFYNGKCRENIAEWMKQEAKEGEQDADKR